MDKKKKILKKKIHKNREFLVELAKKYYINGLSQQEIANHFNLSRPTISNLLRQCREEQIVEIRIHDTSQFTLALQEKMIQTFHLSSCIVVSDESHQADTLTRVGEASAKLIEKKLEEGIELGIAWGTSLYKVVQGLRRQVIVDATVTQIIGGSGALDPFCDGYELARLLAAKLNGDYKTIAAPIVVKTEILKKMLMEEPSIANVFSSMKNLDIALIGISPDNPEDSALVRAGFISSEESQDIFEHGAVGHLCGYHYNKDGKRLDLPINNRVIGIDFETLRKIPEVIGVACGKSKALAILGALRTNCIDTLVTDESAAVRILSEN